MFFHNFKYNTITEMDAPYFTKGVGVSSSVPKTNISTFVPSYDISNGLTIGITPNNADNSYVVNYVLETIENANITNQLTIGFNIVSFSSNVNTFDGSIFNKEFSYSNQPFMSIYDGVSGDATDIISDMPYIYVDFIQNSDGTIASFGIELIVLKPTIYTWSGSGRQVYPLPTGTNPSDLVGSYFELYFYTKSTARKNATMYAEFRVGGIPLAVNAIAGSESYQSLGISNPVIAFMLGYGGSTGGCQLGITDFYQNNTFPIGPMTVNTDTLTSMQNDYVLSDASSTVDALVLSSEIQDANYIMANNTTTQSKFGFSNSTGNYSLDQKYEVNLFTSGSLPVDITYEMSNGSDNISSSFTVPTTADADVLGLELDIDRQLVGDEYIIYVDSSTLYAYNMTTKTATALAASLPFVYSRYCDIYGSKLLVVSDNIYIFDFDLSSQSATLRNTIVPTTTIDFALFSESDVCASFEGGSIYFRDINGSLLSSATTLDFKMGPDTSTAYYPCRDIGYDGRILAYTTDTSSGTLEYPATTFKMYSYTRGDAGVSTYSIGNNTTMGNFYGVNTLVGNGTALSYLNTDAMAFGSTGGSTVVPTLVTPSTDNARTSLFQDVNGNWFVATFFGGNISIYSLTDSMEFNENVLSSDLGINTGTDNLTFMDISYYGNFAINCTTGNNAIGIYDLRDITASTPAVTYSKIITVADSVGAITYPKDYPGALVRYSGDNITDGDDSSDYLKLGTVAFQTT